MQASKGLQQRITLSEFTTVIYNEFPRRSRTLCACQVCDWQEWPRVAQGDTPLKADRDEYKWAREAMQGHSAYRRPKTPAKKPIRLIDVLGVILVGMSLAFIALAMFKQGRDMNKYIVEYINPELCEGDGMACRWRRTSESSQKAVDTLRKMFDDVITIRTVSLIIDMKGEWK